MPNPPAPRDPRRHWRILLLGAHGQVGWELLRTLQTHELAMTTVRSPEQAPAHLPYRVLDLAHLEDLRGLIRETRPNLIVNAAAYTAVDQAEGEEPRALAINGHAPGVIAEEARRLGASLIHYSTDYVYDGEKQGAYTEEQPARPLSAYGRTKLAGDLAIEAAGIPHLILRTSWVYSLRGRNFVRTILGLAGQRPELRVVADQWGAPTWSRTIAEATAQIIAQAARPTGGNGPTLASCRGLYHLCATGKVSRHGVAEAILRLGAPQTPCRVIPVTSEEFPAPAVRPKNSWLSLEKVERTFGFSMPAWDAALALCLAGRQDGA